MKRIIIAISGASGVIYGIELLKELVKRDIEVHLVISESGKLNIAIDTDYSVGDLESMADRVHDNSEGLPWRADRSLPMAW